MADLTQFQQIAWIAYNNLQEQIVDPTTPDADQLNLEQVLDAFLRNDDFNTALNEAAAHIGTEQEATSITIRTEQAVGRAVNSPDGYDNYDNFVTHPVRALERGDTRPLANFFDEGDLQALNQQLADDNLYALQASDYSRSLSEFRIELVNLNPRFAEFFEHVDDANGFAWNNDPLYDEIIPALNDSDSPALNQLIEIAGDEARMDALIAAAGTDAGKASLQHVLDAATPAVEQEAPAPQDEVFVAAADQEAIDSAPVIPVTTDAGNTAALSQTEAFFTQLTETVYNDAMREGGTLTLEDAARRVHYYTTAEENWTHTGFGTSDAMNAQDIARRLGMRDETLPETFDVTDPDQLYTVIAGATIANGWQTHYGDIARENGFNIEATFDTPIAEGEEAFSTALRAAVNTVINGEPEVAPPENDPATPTPEEITPEETLVADAAAAPTTPEPEETIVAEAPPVELVQIFPDAANASMYNAPEPAPETAPEAVAVAEAEVEPESPVDPSTLSREEIVAGLHELQAYEGSGLITLDSFQQGFVLLNPAYQAFFDAVAAQDSAIGINPMRDQLTTALNEDSETLQTMITLSNSDEALQVLTNAISEPGSTGAVDFTLALAEANGVAPLTTDVHSAADPTATPIDNPDIPSIPEIIADGFEAQEALEPATELEPTEDPAAETPEDVSPSDEAPTNTEATPYTGVSHVEVEPEAATEPEAPEQPTHLVQSGDNLWNIIQEQYEPTSMADIPRIMDRIAEMNPELIDPRNGQSYNLAVGVNAHTIFPGQVINMPTAEQLARPAAELDHAALDAQVGQGPSLIYNEASGAALGSPNAPGASPRPQQRPEQPGSAYADTERVAAMHPEL